MELQKTKTDTNGLIPPYGGELKNLIIKDKNLKNGLISIDESRDNQSEIQKITDKYIALIENKLSEKEKEILKVWEDLTS